MKNWFKSKQPQEEKKSDIEIEYSDEEEGRYYDSVCWVCKVDILIVFCLQMMNIFNSYV